MSDEFEIKLVPLFPETERLFAQLERWQAEVERQITVLLLGRSSSSEGKP